MRLKKLTSSTLLAVAAFSIAGCGPNQRIMNSANVNSAVREAPGTEVGTPPPASTFEQDLEAMRTADFKFILVIRRKDGGPLDASDKELISRNTGLQANRRKLSDEGRAVIIGSNFPIEAKLMNELTGRFKTENYSKPDSGPVTFEGAPAPTQTAPDLVPAR